VNRKLKARMIEIFGSQMAFAFIAKEHETYVSKVLNGWRVLPDEKKAKWSQILNCDAELFNFTRIQ